MTYESIDLLYRVSVDASFGDHLGLILSCTPQEYNSGPNGFLHKVEITTLPDLASASIAVTHEVKPGLDPCAQIIPVNEKLKIACFDSGCIIPIKNFGYKKTFNSEVSSKLAHHNGQVCCIAASSAGNKLASACTKGIVTLYQVREEEITFLSRTDERYDSFVTALSFIEPIKSTETGSADDGNCPLIYATSYGRLMLLDTRCSLAEPLVINKLADLDPRAGVTSLLHTRDVFESLLYVGGSDGQLITFDLRMGCQPLCERNSKSGKTIRRMKKVSVKDGAGMRHFLAFSNSTDQIEILDLITMKPHQGWKCDRYSGGMVRDLVQAGDRIITCGDNVSIGSWHWDPQDD